MSSPPSFPTGGAALRRLALPLAMAVGPLALIVLIGWLIDSHSLLFSLAMVIGLGVLVYVTARWIDRIEGERRLSAREAETATERVRLIVETAEHAFVAIDESGVVTEWNPKAEQTFGWSHDDAVGRVLAELVIPERMRDAHRQGMKRFIGTGEGTVVNRPIQLDALHRDGHEFPVEMTISPLRVGDGWTFNAFIQDITDRRRAEAAVAASEARFRALVHEAPGGIFETDAAGASTLISDRGLEMVGLTAEEARGSGWAKAVHPEDLERVVAEWAAAVDTHQPFSSEFRVVRPGGSVTWVASSATPITDETGSVNGYIGSMTDVTERKAAADVLAAGESRFRALATQSPGGIYEVNIEGMVTSANDSFAEMTGIEESDLGNVRYLDVVHPDDRGSMSKLWFGSVESGEPFVMEYRLAGPGGKVTWVSGRATTVYDDAGNPTGYFGAALDITKRRLLEADLRVHEQVTAHMAEGVVLVRHSDDRIVFANRRFSDIFGYELGELDGMNVNEVNAPGEIDPIEMTTEIQSAVAEYGFWTGNIKNLKKDGTVFWTHATVSVFEHPEHGLVSVSVQEDITERKRADDLLRHERHMLAESQEIGRVGSWQWDLDANTVTWSREQFRLYGMDPAKGTPSPAEYMAVVHPDDRDEVGESMGRSMLDPGPFTAEYRVMLSDGSVRTLLVSGDLASESTRRLAGTTRDITAEREAERAVRQAEGRFRGAFENAPIGMAEIGLDGRFVRVNAALSEIIGHPREELEGRSFESVTHPDDVERDEEQVRSMLAGETGSRQVEKRYLHANGHPVWVQLNGTLVHDDDGRPDHFLIQVQDITDRRRYEKQLQHMADHDPLTGLLNRRSFERELQRHAAEIERYGVQGAALVLDLDNFKYYNDTLGHHVGDELIVRMSRVLEQRLRETDVLARLGGDEFAVILPKENVDGARLVADALLECIRAEGRKLDAGRGKAITASIGIAMFDDEERLTGEDVLVNADLAMYDAKEAGRDRLAVYSTEGHTASRMKGRIKWVDQIRKALDEDGFTLLAQPITDLSGRQSHRYELLLRMNGDDGDLIPPGTFLYIAERLGWVNEIDRWVSHQAIQILAEQHALGREIYLEVNLSGLSMGDDELLAQVEHDLHTTGVDPSRLTFEITETAAVANISKARTFAERLSELGCRFALDDFGAGFGSFYYLKYLPFDFLKIDGEFVKGCTSSETDRLLIEAVVGIARGMGKRTIAEFVGDEETVRTLRRLGVDFGQGYHLGRPEPLPELLSVRGKAPRI